MIIQVFNESEYCQIVSRSSTSKLANQQLYDSKAINEYNYTNGSIVSVSPYPSSNSYDGDWEMTVIEGVDGLEKLII